MQGVIDSAIAKAKVVPLGVRLAWSGENQLVAEEGTFMMRALMLAIILVYMLMASLFNSLLTAFAAIFGTLPTALALGRGSEFRQPMGITVIGGLLLGTVLTLLVISAVYTIFDDVGQWLSGLGHRKAKPKS